MSASYRVYAMTSHGREVASSKPLTDCSMAEVFIGGSGISAPANTNRGFPVVLAPTYPHLPLVIHTVIVSTAVFSVGCEQGAR